MFIDSWFYKALRSSGTKCMVRRTHRPVHCAPLERQTLVGREVYKHLAPLEPEHRLVAALLRCAFVLNKR